KMPWYEKKPKEDVVESRSGNARIKDPQGKEKDDAGIKEALEEDMNKKTQFGVRLEGNIEEEAEEGSTTDINDFVSHGSEPWEKPIHKHDQVVHTRRYLHRETPKRLFPWNSRKKSLSPESKEMLVKKMKEVEVFNASKMSAKTRDHGKKITSTQKEKRARCYICKERGHVFWKCQNKKKDARIEKQKKSVKPTNKNVAEKIKYPEKVHVITDYMIEGTDDAIWDEVWKFEHFRKDCKESSTTQEQSNLILEDEEASLLMATHETEHKEILLNKGAWHYIKERRRLQDYWL
ncbi:ARID DNA-binding domain-containing protein, partial [Tanacetum coccineum]